MRTITKQTKKSKTKVSMNQLEILGHNLGAKIVSLNFLPIQHVNKTWKLHHVSEKYHIKTRLICYSLMAICNELVSK